MTLLIDTEDKSGRSIFLGVIKKTLLFHCPQKDDNKGSEVQEVNTQLP